MSPRNRDTNAGGDAPRRRTEAPPRSAAVGTSYQQSPRGSGDAVLQMIKMPPAHT